MSVSTCCPIIAFGRKHLSAVWYHQGLLWFSSLIWTVVSSPIPMGSYEQVELTAANCLLQWPNFGGQLLSMQLGEGGVGLSQGQHTNSAAVPCCCSSECVIMLPLHRPEFFSAVMASTAAVASAAFLLYITPRSLIHHSTYPCSGAGS